MAKVDENGAQTLSDVLVPWCACSTRPRSTKSSKGGEGTWRWKCPGRLQIIWASFIFTPYINLYINSLIHYHVIAMKTRRKSSIKSLLPDLCCPKAVPSLGARSLESFSESHQYPESASRNDQSLSISLSQLQPSHELCRSLPAHRSLLVSRHDYLQQTYISICSCPQTSPRSYNPKDAVTLRISQRRWNYSTMMPCFQFHCLTSLSKLTTGAPPHASTHH